MDAHKETLVIPVKLQALRQQLDAALKRKKSIQEITLSKKRKNSVYDRLKAIIND